MAISDERNKLYVNGFLNLLISNNVLMHNEVRSH